MSEYSYDDRPRRHRSTREREREREPEYVTETTYIERGGRGGGAVRDLVYRPAREDSIEDIPRDFPPPGAEYRQSKYRETYEPRRTRSAHRDYDYDDYYRHDRGRRPRDDDYHDDGYYSERPRPQRRKSIVDNLKEIGEAAGLGGVIGAVTGRSRSRSRTRKHRDYDSDRDYYGYDDRRSRRYSSSSRSPSRRGGHRNTEKKWEQAAKAAIVAGAVEAFRSRNAPGPWTGEKGQRIATAALGAAGIDSLVDKDPDKHSKRHVAESAIGGLLANRVANGPRSQSRGRRGSRSPSRSRSRSRSIFSRSLSRGRAGSRDRGEGGGENTLAKVASGGAILAAGKALYNRVRSKSRSRKERSRSSSADSYDPPSRNRRSRGNYDRGRSMDDTYSGAQGANSDRRLAAATGGGALTTSRGRRDYSSSSTSTTDMELKRKKLRGKELLTAGLATVATIHAAHGVYSSMVASEKRRKLVMEGEMSPEEARKRKSKNMLQDAAAVGIAALGIKSAFSEWKEMNEQRHSVHELEKRRRKRRKARERMEREARENALGSNGSANPYAYPVAANPYPTTYADANPYASVPPPPIGAPPSARY